jgi:ATP-dependent Clp protease protease subunit
MIEDAKEIESRKLYLFGEITEETTKEFLPIFLTLAEESKDPIEVILNSPGGQLDQALAIYDAMRMIENEVIVLVLGVCASAANIVLLGADERLTTKNSEFMLHEPRTMFEVRNSGDHRTAVKQYEKAVKVIEGILTSRSNLNAKTLQKYINLTDCYFDSEEAKRIGFIHRIIGEKKNGKSRKGRSK